MYLKQMGTLYALIKFLIIITNNFKENAICQLNFILLKTDFKLKISHIPKFGEVAQPSLLCSKTTAALKSNIKDLTNHEIRVS